MSHPTGSTQIAKRATWLGASAFAVLAAFSPAPVVAAVANTTVYGVSYDAEKGALIIKGSAPMVPKVVRLESPRRMVIDLPGTVLKPSYQQLDGIPGSGISRIRVGQYLAGTTRVVLELNRAVDLAPSSRGNDVWVPVRAGVAVPVVAAVAPVMPSPQVAADPVIRAIAYQQGGFTIVMDRIAPYWSHVRSGAGVTYTVVFPHTKLSAELANAGREVNNYGVKRWHAEQVGVDTRLEVEMTRPPSFEITSSGYTWQFRANAVAAKTSPVTKPSSAATEKPEIKPSHAVAGRTPAPVAVVTPKPSPAIVRAKPSTRPASGTADEPAWPGAPDAPFALRHVDNRWQLMLSADQRFTYKTTAVGDDRLHVDITGARVALPRDSVYIDNGLIARVRVQPHGANTTRLTIDLDQPVRHVARLMPNQRSLLLGLGRVTKDRVTLDPGHGGTDTGTVGTKGTREKDVTLQIATRLARVMGENGMSVQMTRMKDLEILLRPRVEMANRNDSDVFVSIHANSFGNNRGVEGIETYYFTDESYPLAKSIHKQLLKSLNQPDRGVRKNNFYVVHHTQMPAALIEIGYLSNPHEETLLASAAYQEKAAQAIYTGIKDFLAERKAKP